MVHARGDRGAIGLIDAIVGVGLVVLGLAAALSMVRGSLGMQAEAEHWDRAAQYGQNVIAKARQAQYSDLGFYLSDYTDAGVSYDPDRQVPVWESITDAQTLPNNPADCFEAGGGSQCPTFVDESHVHHGNNRPVAVPLFQPPTQFLPERGETAEDGMYYRVDTWVTEADTARRITVQTQYGPAQDLLDGDCGPKTTCVVSSLLRAASASEQPDRVEGQALSPACSDTEAAFCATYVQGGRVLSGATLATGSQYPLQTEPVELIVRLTKPADQVSASWRWNNPTNQTITIPNDDIAFEKIDADPTRWRAVIPADQRGIGATPKGWIRPGAPTITFQARLTTGATISHDHQPPGWSYANDTNVTITPDGTWPASWCSARTPLRVEVTGMSIGYTANGSNPSAADRLEATFAAIGADGKARATRVEGQVIPSSVEQVDEYDENSPGAGDIRIGGSTRAIFTVRPPNYQQCPTSSSNVTITLHRAIDNTATPITLTLP